MSMRDWLTRVASTPQAAMRPIIVSPIDQPHTKPTSDQPNPPASDQPNPPVAVNGVHFDLRRPAGEDSSLHWDVESRSAAILGSGKQGVGARAYADHPTTEILCVSYARGNGPVETWVPGQPIPEVVLAAAADPKCSWVAHNAAFERAMLEGILVLRHSWPVVPVARHVCTMSLALAHAYPGSLEDL